MQRVHGSALGSTFKKRIRLLVQTLKWWRAASQLPNLKNCNPPARRRLLLGVQNRSHTRGTKDARRAPKPTGHRHAWLLTLVQSLAKSFHLLPSQQTITPSHLAFKVSASGSDDYFTAPLYTTRTKAKQNEGKIKRRMSLISLHRLLLGVKD